MILNEYNNFKDLFQNFPCETLNNINQLWLKYSKGRFGFSAHLKILEDVEFFKLDSGIGVKVPRSRAIYPNNLDIIKVILTNYVKQVGWLEVPKLQGEEEQQSESKKIYPYLLLNRGNVDDGYSGGYYEGSEKWFLVCNSWKNISDFWDVLYSLVQRLVDCNIT
ncbi:hypothetical protein WA1_48155 [Scytonema hofmannii PCC 7110]|uniref:GUN4-like domain-containing protein n=1 Tax=Scytonema hofmannii PCC 7110 TaxID=128403 RepID=A0A139WY75_9CYAN|nr:hypothetical protein WA1_48155 [Scytonema hofmannii PCC 7110]